MGKNGRERQILPENCHNEIILCKLLINNNIKENNQEKKHGKLRVMQDNYEFEASID